jgi:hypothetical protein
MAAFLPAVLHGALAACAASSFDKGPEDDVPSVDGKADTQRKPTDHGELPGFGTPVVDELSASAGFHAWQFTLHGDARVTAVTSAAEPGGAEIDTVLYLYKEKPTGWGAYVARNDDHAGSLWSRLERPLGAGRYRVLVKGYTRAERGRFALAVGCDGAGCAPPVAAGGCLFGERYGDLAARPGLEIVNREVLTAASPLGARDAEQVVRAVRESAHTDVTTAVEAFSRVDDGEINRTFVFEPAAQRSFVVYEYGAGDNSYGAYFVRQTTERVAAIRDGDLYECQVSAETCLLGDSYQALLADPAFTTVSTRVVTAADQVSGREAEQVLAALVRIYGDGIDLAAGLAAADDDRVNLTRVLHTPTASELVLVELGAGDTQVGSIFFAESLQVAAFIDDGFLDACALFAPRGGAAAGELCRGASDCQAGLLCTGQFAGRGRCVDTTDLAGEGQACTADGDCGTAALVCAGATRGGGLCNPAWMRGRFGDSADAALVDGPSGAVTRRLPVYGLATVDTDVELVATIAHSRASDLQIVLVNPLGTEVVVFDGQTAGVSASPLVLNEPLFGFSGDESVNGEWALIVRDRVAGITGRLVDWRLTITSRWD